MKGTFLAAAIGAALTFFAPSASAQLYAGVGVTLFQTDIDDEDITPGAMMGRLGWEFTPFFALEGEAALGIVDDEVDILGQPVDVGIESAFGAFAVGKIPLGVVDFFGRVGYANVAIEADAGGGVDLSEDGSGLAYGGGMNFNIFMLRMRAEYTRYEIDDGEVDSVGLSALLKF